MKRNEEIHLLGAKKKKKAKLSETTNDQIILNN